MITSFFAILALSFFGRAESQADALLDLVPYIWDINSIAFDYSGSLWAVNDGKDALLLSRIDQRGRPLLDKIEVRKKGLEPMVDGMLWVQPYSMTFDRWNNAWFIYFTGIQHDYHPPDFQPSHLARVTPKGEVQYYHPWPGIEPDGAYVGIMPGDTLIVVGKAKDGSIRFGKGLLNETGMKPILEGLDTRNLASLMRRGNEDFYDKIPYWGKEHGLIAVIDYTDGSKVLYLSSFSSSSFKGYEYNWRDYIWRSYTDAWTGKVSISPYKDSGYVLCIPDPLDSATTHLLRINEDGTLIPPSELKDGGSFSARSFDRLPKSAEQKVKLELHIKKHGTVPPKYYDAAAVRFWGVDLDGNLYYFSKSRNY